MLASEKRVAFNQLDELLTLQLYKYNARLYTKLPTTLQNTHRESDGGGDASSAPTDPPGGPEDSVPPNAQNGIGMEQNENGFRFVFDVELRICSMVRDRRQPG